MSHSSGWLHSFAHRGCSGWVRGGTSSQANVVMLRMRGFLSRCRVIMGNSSPGPVMEPFVTTEWLAAKLSSPNVRVLDGSWYLPSMKRDPKAEFSSSHIPGAQFFDMEEASDHATDLPHMAPSVDFFQSYITSLGVDSSDSVVVYDTAGLLSAARVWWLFRLMGMDNVSVLDGGFPKWVKEGRPTESTTSPPPTVAAPPTLKFCPDLIRDRGAVAAAVADRSAEIVDARAASRFSGAEPEPREGLRRGHIPTSKNVFWKDVLREDGTVRTPEEIRRTFTSAGVDLSRPIITTCGSGVTAASLLLALRHAGVKDVAMYDGSWSDWGREGYGDVEMGEAKRS